MEWICEAVAISISFSIVIDDFMSINIIWCEFQMKCFPLHLNSDSDWDSVFSCRFHLIFFPYLCAAAMCNYFASLLFRFVLRRFFFCQSANSSSFTACRIVFIIVSLTGSWKKATSLTILWLWLWVIAVECGWKGISELNACVCTTLHCTVRSMQAYGNPYKY